MDYQAFVPYTELCKRDFIKSEEKKASFKRGWNKILKHCILKKV